HRDVRLCGDVLRAHRLSQRRCGRGLQRARGRSAARHRNLAGARPRHSRALYLRTGKGLLLKLTCELAEVSWFSGIRAGPLQAITLIHEPSHDSARFDNLSSPYRRRVMNKLLVAAVIASAIATFLAPQLAQARSCSGVTATARGVTQGIATTKA